MPKAKATAGQVWLEICMPNGDKFYLRPPLEIHTESNVILNQIQFGQKELLRQILLGKTVGVSQQGVGVVLCKPFQYMRYVDEIPAETVEDKVLNAMNN